MQAEPEVLVVAEVEAEAAAEAQDEGRGVAAGEAETALISISECLRGLHAGRRICIDLAHKYNAP